MSTTNLTPPIQGLVLQMADVLGKSLQHVEAETREFEHKSEGAERKVHSPYQERLNELCNNQDTLKGEPAGLGTEEIPGALHHQYHCCRTSHDLKPQPSQQNLKCQMHLHLGNLAVLPHKRNHPAIRMHMFSAWKMEIWLNIGFRNPKLNLVRKTPGLLLT